MKGRSLGHTWTLRRFNRDLVDDMGVGRHKGVSVALSREKPLKQACKGLDWARPVEGGLSWTRN
jgi:hypothetical protein